MTKAFRQIMFHVMKPKKCCPMLFVLLLVVMPWGERLTAINEFRSELASPILHILAAVFADF
jgi:hypothetical protein